MDFNTLVNLRKYLSIKHHVPGRIRIKFNLSIANDPLAKELLNSHNSLPPGIRDVRLNALARSVIIEYAAKSIPPSLIETLVTSRSDEQAVEALRELDDILRTLSSKENTDAE